MKTQASGAAALLYSRGKGWETPFPAVDSDKTLVLAFGAREFDKDDGPFRELRRAFPRSVIAGCSSSGEIAGGSLRDDGIAGAALRFERTRVAYAAAPVRSQEDSFRAGDLLAQQLAGPGLRAVLVFSDGLKVNGTELARGLNAALPTGVVVSGGLAGDGSRFEKTWVLRDGLPVEGFVSGVGLYGDHVRVGHGSRGGWDVFGPERVVTRSKGNILFELDGKPALPLYKKYLGERAAELPASALLFPLALRRDREDANSLVRTILSVDEQQQSLTFAGDIPQGYLAQLMRANFDRLIEGAGESALMTRRLDNSGSACLSVAVSCVGRRLVLGDRVEEELERAFEALPEGSTQVGFYSYGELSPYANGRCDLHNQTMTLTTIREE
jgi:hypothetical protein